MTQTQTWLKLNIYPLPKQHYERHYFLQKKEHQLTLLYHCAHFCTWPVSALYVLNSQVVDTLHFTPLLIKREMKNVCLIKVSSSIITIFFNNFIIFEDLKQRLCLILKSLFYVTGYIFPSKMKWYTAFMFLCQLAHVSASHFCPTQTIIKPIIKFHRDPYSRVFPDNEPQRVLFQNYCLLITQLHSYRGNANSVTLLHDICCLV